MISEKSTISWQKWRYTEIKRLIFTWFFRLQISVANISNLTVKVLPFWNFEAIKKKEKKITVAQQYWGWVVKRPHSWARQGTQFTSSQWKCTVPGNPSAQRNTAFTTLKWPIRLCQVFPAHWNDWQWLNIVGMGPMRILMCLFVLLQSVLSCTLSTCGSVLDMHVKPTFITQEIALQHSRGQCVDNAVK